MPLDCVHCGARNPDPANFCRNCGRALGDTGVRSATRLTPLMQTWRQLNHQVTRKEARRLLGEPFFIDLEDSRDPAACETWVYEYTSGGAPAIGAPGIGAPGLGAPAVGAPGSAAPGVGAPGAERSSIPLFPAGTSAQSAVGASGHERRTRGSLRFQISEGRLVGWTEPDWELLAPAASEPA